MADITKIQPMGDSTQYTLGARYLTHNPNNTSTFLRGDNTFTNTLVGPLRLGGPDTAANTGYATDNVGSNNYIAFYGVYGDAPGSYSHCYVGERIWGDKATTQEQSELLLFKGNDVGTSNPGPDRIRLLASETDIQCYTSALSGSFMAVGEAGGTQVCKFRSDGITSTVNITAPRFIGTADRATADGSGNTITSKYVTLDTTQTVSGQKTFTGNLLIGSSGAGGRLNGGATNGGINSILIGDDVWLGDCNVGGIMAMKSTGSNCGFYFYNSGGTQIGQLYAQGNSYITYNKALHIAGSVIGTSWVGSRSMDRMALCVDASDATSSVAYSVCGVRFQNKTFAVSSERSGNNFGLYGWNNSRTENGYDCGFYASNDLYFHCTTRVYGAVWNDYAEYRKNNPEEIQEPGRCVYELGNGILVLTTQRLMRGCEIISDTFGFAIGQDKENGYNTPIASNGRVLAYPYENIEEFATHIGWPVCSGPNGTVSIMTEEEETKYPSRIIGTISEIPVYEKWGTGNVEVNGRVWIRIR